MTSHAERKPSIASGNPQYTVACNITSRSSSGVAPVFERADVCDAAAMHALFQRHARGVRNRLEHSHMDDIFQHGVHEFIQEFILDNGRLGEIITKQYLI